MGQAKLRSESLAERGIETREDFINLLFAVAGDVALETEMYVHSRAELIDKLASTIVKLLQVMKIDSATEESFFKTQQP